MQQLVKLWMKSTLCLGPLYRTYLPPVPFSVAINSSRRCYEKKTIQCQKGFQSWSTSVGGRVLGARGLSFISLRLLLQLRLSYICHIITVARCFQLSSGNRSKIKTFFFSQMWSEITIAARDPGVFVLCLIPYRKIAWCFGKLLVISKLMTSSSECLANVF